MASSSEQDSFARCEEYLVKVSRTFAVNIGILRGDFYKAVLLAYLLCRIADTVEDDPEMPSREKQEYLRRFAGIFSSSENVSWDDAAFFEEMRLNGSPDEVALCRDARLVVREFSRLPSSLIARIAPHIQEMATGMADFQRKEPVEGVVFLDNREELERYCYFVAGTVGLMLTETFVAEYPGLASSARERLFSRSVSFGLGLQLTNIAKDFFSDNVRGWCYVPRDFFADEGIDPLKDRFSEHPAAFLRIHKRLIDLAAFYLDEALAYSLAIPRKAFRYRLFCLWPLFMALESLIAIKERSDLLFAGRPVKISRAEVRRIVRNTSLAVMSNGMLSRMYRCRRELLD